MSLITYIIFIIYGCFSLFLIYTFILNGIAYRQYRHHAHYVSVNDTMLHLCYSGKVGPTVIFEAGAGGCFLTWNLVQPALSKFCKE